MATSMRLAVCPRCACHAKIADSTCPCCGGSLRAEGGWFAPAAAVIAMGLTAACSTSDTGGATSTSGGGDGGYGGYQTTTVSEGSISAVSAYTLAANVGPGPTGGGFGGDGGAGGDPGAGGAPGTGGAGGI